MRLFKIKGGIHPDGRKELAENEKIEQIPLPTLMRIPLKQHTGAPANPIVEKGDTVKKGQVLALSRGSVSATIHAPTSGRIIAIGRFVAPHASGLPEPTITLRPDGKDEWGDLPPPLDPFATEPDEIARRVAEAGVVGLGGAAFPAAVKLNLRTRGPLHTLVINAAECEPYITCDDRLMRERAAEILDGVAIICHTIGVTKALIGVEKNKPDAIKALKREAQAQNRYDIKVVEVPTRYPTGFAKHLVQILTGQEVPARALTADVGVIVQNVATTYAIQQAVRLGRPLISRIVTVSGEMIRRKGNFEVPIGTPISHIIEHCGGFIDEPEKLLLGGSMMGDPVSSTRAPVVKGSNGILALGRKETSQKPIMPCIRCTSCVAACPCGLMPYEMAARIKADELESAVDIGLRDCIACGSCSFVCPANIPLVQYFNYAKGSLTAKQRAAHKQEETKRLVQFHDARMEKIKKEKQAAMARMKAEREAKKRKEEQEEATMGSEGVAGVMTEDVISAPDHHKARAKA
ncbi:electron transport complex subunit RsxC [Cohaesibacter haloalkalitolerans]|uniref:electron transport complex subunit RsxC n=1 Tax=Cohaesibacter haloalkalitolerans TaxID=1162980 RepID=UPI000E64F5D0|nr:electron transport complex subunit RsxC [Cohaesibacter haloalkalitolerans]